jgi:twitching motility protein PilT
MSLVPSLLQAIVRVDGEALVMHVGEKPYVVSPNGQVDLATRGLTFDAVNGIVAQLLPPDALKSLDDMGATQFELPTLDEFPGEHFTVTAARGGDDVWAEIRRRQSGADDDVVPADLFGRAAAPDATAAPAGDDLILPREDQLWPKGRSTAAADDDLRLSPDAPSPALGAVEAASAVVEAVAPIEAPRLVASVEGPQAVASTETPQAVAPFEAPEAAAPIEPPPSVAPIEAPQAFAPIETTADAVEPAFEAVRPIETDAPVPDAAVVQVETILVAHETVQATSESTEVAASHDGATLSAAARADEPGPAIPEWPASRSSWLAAPSPSDVLDNLGLWAGKTRGDEPQSAPTPPPTQDEPAAQAVDPTALFDAAINDAHPALERPVVAQDGPPAVQPAPSPSPESAFEAATQATLPAPQGDAAESVSEAAMSDQPFGPFGTSPGIREGAPITTPLPRSIDQSAPPAASLSAEATGRMTEFIVPDEPPQAAVVLPIGRGGREPSLPNQEPGAAALERLLRQAASRGASAVYLSSNARPSVRLDGDIQTLDGTAQLSDHEIEVQLLSAMPERAANAHRAGQPSEWVWDLADIGRVRCTSFRDHRGPGAVFRIVAVRAQSATQLGLSREIQGLAGEPDGLILVSGPRSNGKSTLISSLVDVINKTRRDYVITIESEINVVHERQGAFISQREVRGGTDEVLAAARAALREDPDVLVLEDLRTASLMSVALDAAAAGQLVIGGVPAHHATGAIDRLIELYQPEQRRQVQLALAQTLRGVVTQVLLRKSSGGRVAAREVLLNGPLVSSLLAEGRTAQLPVAIEGGRKHGMVPLNDALIGFVQSGVVDVREAYRRASDRAGLLDLLKRQGIDTSFVERLA